MRTQATIEVGTADEQTKLKLVHTIDRSTVPIQGAVVLEHGDTAIDLADRLDIQPGNGKLDIKVGGLIISIDMEDLD